MADIPNVLDDVASLRQLYAIKHALIKYFYYIHHYVPLISIACGLALCLGLILLMKHSDTVSRHEHSSFSDWCRHNHSSIGLSGIIGLVFGAGIVIILTFGRGNFGGGIYSGDGVSSNVRCHPVNYVNRAIHYRKHTIPKIQHHLKRIEIRYQHKPNRTELDQQIENDYKHDELQKLHHYEHYVNNTHYLKLHAYNYY